MKFNNSIFKIGNIKRHPSRTLNFMLFLLALWPYYASAQIPVKIMYDIAEKNILNSVISLSDGSIIGTGKITTTNKAGQVFLLKLDKYQNIEWSKDVGGTLEDIGYSITKFQEGFLIAGTTASFGYGGTDIYLISVSENGDTLWTSAFGGSGNETVTNMIIGENDSIYVFGGTTSFTHGLKDCYIACFDKNGKKAWIRNFGTANNEEAGNMFYKLGNKDEFVFSLGTYDQDTDSSYSLLAYSNKGQYTTYKNNEIFSERTNTNLVKTFKNEYLLFYTVNNAKRELFVSSYDSAFHFLGKKKLLTNNYTELLAKSAMQLPDSSILVAGYSKQSTAQNKGFLLNTSATGDYISFISLGDSTQTQVLGACPIQDNIYAFGFSKLNNTTEKSFVATITFSLESYYSKVITNNALTFDYSAAVETQNYIFNLGAKNDENALSKLYIYCSDKSGKQIWKKEYTTLDIPINTQFKAIRAGKNSILLSFINLDSELRSVCINEYGQVVKANKWMGKYTMDILKLESLGTDIYALAYNLNEADFSDRSVFLKADSIGNLLSIDTSVSYVPLSFSLIDKSKCAIAYKKNDSIVVALVNNKLKPYSNKTINIRPIKLEMVKQSDNRLTLISTIGSTLNIVHIDTSFTITSQITENTQWPVSLTGACFIQTSIYVSCTAKNINQNDIAVYELTANGTIKNKYSWGGRYDDSPTYLSRSEQGILISGITKSYIRQPEVSNILFIKIPIHGYSKFSWITGDSVFCSGSSAFLEHARKSCKQFYWSTNESGKTIQVSTTGNINCDAIDSLNYIYFSTNFKVIESPLPHIDVTSENINACKNNTVKIETVNNDTTIIIQSYLWNTGETSKDITVNTSKLYKVTAYTPHLCYSSDSISIHFSEPFNNQVLCMVSVDSFYNKYRINWIIPQGKNINHFKVYRGDQKELVDTFNFHSGISKGYVIDWTSSPDINSEMYRISVVDTCGNESAASPYHKTIHLNFNNNQLVWEPYIIEGRNDVPDKYYYIYRGINPENMMLYDSVGRLSTTFNDNKATQSYYYGMGIKNLCSLNNVTPISNKVLSTDTRNNYFGFNSISIAPNPMTNQTLISCTNYKEKPIEIKLTDMMGKVLLIDNMEDGMYTLQRCNLAAGMYLLVVGEYKRMLVIE